ncbi:hypothetical protein ABT112_05050 [Streptomyces sp. NPDC002055]|uniref:hypothetical protein n=1 Tax=Streptomyces sp. NPDC002055 TaxID=3154534 RepID=UPI00331A166D
MSAAAVPAIAAARTGGIGLVSAAAVDSAEVDGTRTRVPADQGGRLLVQPRAPQEPRLDRETEDDQARVKELRHRKLGLTETVLTHDLQKPVGS